MEPASPARLYAALIGAGLFVLGILGFFHDLSWLNFLHLASGALGLVLATCAARSYALAAGLAFTALAIWDFSADGWLHLAIGVLGLAAYASTRGSSSTHDVQEEPGDPPGRLEARAKAAAESP
jgi:hypothetical protein